MIEISALLIDSGNGWFNSVKPRYKIFSKPELSVCSYQSELTQQSGNKLYNFEADPIAELLKNLNKGYTAIGYIGYDYSHSISERRIKNPNNMKEPAGVPETYFQFYKSANIKEGDPDELEQIIDDQPAGFPAQRREASSNVTHDEYLNIVEKAREYIANGDIYQVNLSQKFTRSPVVNVPAYSRVLYKNQPVPYFTYIDFGPFQLVSGSMELFLMKKGKNLISRPIKGTIKRSADRKADQNLMNSLRENPKERAENVMIVDLMRNDLGRICEFGTIEVPYLFDVKKFSTLYQMESEVRGVLREEIKLGEIINSTFPPGSVTGAPKSRCLEIIDELEPHKRGPYCGAIGIFYPDGDFTLSVAIRILLNFPDKSIYWMGGGIVWDSDPQKEYEETLLKARAISNSWKSDY